MLCFCHNALQPLGLGLPSLNLSVSVAMPKANLALGLANWLGARALPAAPWQPGPDWLALQLPRLQLNASAMATISALAQLRAQIGELRGQTLDVARFKQLTGLSRKYAIPLLEYLDRERVTRKVGDQRLVL